MPRVLVVTDDHGQVLMDEGVRAEILRDDRAAGQLAERLVWAVNDAEEMRDRPRRRSRPRATA